MPTLTCHVCGHVKKYMISLLWSMSHTHHNKCAVYENMEMTKIIHIKYIFIGYLPELKHLFPAKSVNILHF